MFLPIPNSYIVHPSTLQTVSRSPSTLNCTFRPAKLTPYTLSLIHIFIKWFDDSARTWNRQALFQAVWNTDCSRITDEMTKLLRKTISYHDYLEDYYHAFLAGIFAGAGYIVESNKEHGEGRSDVVVYDTENSRVAVFEAKYSKSLEQMESDCDAALQQIEEKMYAREYEDEYDHILCYGIAFYKKRCLVKKMCIRDRLYMYQAVLPEEQPY